MFAALPTALATTRGAITNLSLRATRQRRYWAKHLFRPRNARRRPSPSPRGSTMRLRKTKVWAADSRLGIIARFPAAKGRHYDAHNRRHWPPHRRGRRQRHSQVTCCRSPGSTAQISSDASICSVVPIEHAWFGWDGSAHRLYGTRLIVMHHLSLG
jgi:hypothetical protein